jgi:flagellar biosynthetic protein FliQ
MTTDAALDLVRKSFMVAAQISAPVLFAALLMGVVVGVLQAATQVNEPSVTFVMKLLAVAVAGSIAGPFVVSTVVEYARSSIASIALVVR